MMKKFFTLLVAVVTIFSVVAQAQNKSFHKQLPSETDVQTNVVIKNIDAPQALLGEPIGLTSNYDYFTNSVVRDQILFSAGTIHLANMVRPYLTSTARNVVHSIKSSGVWTNQSVSLGAGGWPQIDIGLTGSLIGTVGIVYHTPNNLALWDGSTGYIKTQFDANTDPSVQFSGEKIFLATSGNRLKYKFYRSTDFGATISLYDTIDSYNPSPIWWGGANGGVEVGMSKSANEQYLVHFGTNQGNTLGAGGASTAHVFDGWARDSADATWMISSSDAGTTWTGKTFGWDGDITVVSGYHTPRYAPLFENFGQMDLAVTNSGVTHVVANGYGLNFNTTMDTSIGTQFPVLYWNSVSNTWKSISSQAIDTVQAIGDFYPTNSIGQAYPSISVSDDGQVLYAIWTGPQFTAGQLDTASNGAAAPATYYWRDLYHAFSQDGGNNWTYGGVIAGEKNYSEVFGHAAQHLEKVNATTYRAHIVYLADLTTGVGPFDLVLTDNPLMYATYDIIGTSVENEGLVNSFKLAQNYPNPFNPNTLIEYSLQERSNVTIKVFDILGKEVASLVNSEMNAGSHKVTFDASDLASGMYVYTINAGNFQESKKMVLMK